MVSGGPSIASTVSASGRRAAPDSPVTTIHKPRNGYVPGRARNRPRRRRSRTGAAAAQTAIWPSRHAVERVRDETDDHEAGCRACGDGADPEGEAAHAPGHRGEQPARIARRGRGHDKPGHGEASDKSGQEHEPQPAQEGIERSTACRPRRRGSGAVDREHQDAAGGVPVGHAGHLPHHGVRAGRESGHAKGQVPMPAGVCGHPRTRDRRSTGIDQPGGAPGCHEVFAEPQLHHCGSPGQ